MKQVLAVFLVFFMVLTASGVPVGYACTMDSGKAGACCPVNADAPMPDCCDTNEPVVCDTPSGTIPPSVATVVSALFTGSILSLPAKPWPMAVPVVENPTFQSVPHGYPPQSGLFIKHSCLLI